MRKEPGPHFELEQKPMTSASTPLKGMCQHSGYNSFALRYIKFGFEQVYMRARLYTECVVTGDSITHKTIDDTAKCGVD